MATHLVHRIDAGQIGVDQLQHFQRFCPCSQSSGKSVYTDAFLLSSLGDLYAPLHCEGIGIAEVYRYDSLQLSIKRQKQQNSQPEGPSLLHDAGLSTAVPLTPLDCGEREHEAPSGHTTTNMEGDGGLPR